MIARPLLQRVPAVAAVMAALLLACLPLSVALAMPAAQDAASSLVGEYISDLLPSDQSDGLTITLTLFDDGTAEAVSAEANDTAPLVEVGTWTDNGDGTFTLTLTGTAAANYPNPVDIVFNVDGDTIAAPDLTGFGDDGLVLTRNAETAEAAPTEAPTEEAAPEAAATEAATPAAAEEGAAVAAAESITATESVTVTAAVTESATVTDTAVMTEEISLPGVWGAVVEAGAGIPAVVSIWLSDDGTAQGVAHFFDGLTAPTAVAGEWAENGDATLTITMTHDLVAGEDGSAEQVEMDEPTPQTFEWVDGALVGADFTLFRMDAPKPNVEIVSYVSDTLPAASSPGRVIALSLGDDGSAAFATDFLNGEEVIVELGEWVENDDGTITLTLTGREDVDYDEPVVITFEEDADGALVAVEYDETLFGAEGLTLYPEAAIPATPAVTEEPAATEEPTATEEPAAEATPEPTEEAAGN